MITDIPPVRCVWCRSERVALEGRLGVYTRCAIGIGGVLHRVLGWYFCKHGVADFLADCGIRIVISAADKWVIGVQGRQVQRTAWVSRVFTAAYCEDRLNFGPHLRKINSIFTT
jgi:hypothetical protein